MLRGDLRAYRGFMLRMQSLAAQPSHEVEEQGEVIDNWFLDRPRGLFSSSMVAGIAKALGRAVQSDAKRHVVRLGVAMHLYRARHGSFPETLDALVPECIEQIPTDPYSGTPLRLKRSDTGWVVYSVGPSKSETHADSYLAGLRSKDDDVAGLMFGYQGTP